MRKVLKSFMLLTAALGVAYGDTLNWDGTVNGNVWSIFYTSPYKATDATPGANPVNLTLYCLDYNHEIAPPYQWQASITSLNWPYLSGFTYGTVAGSISDPVYQAGTIAPMRRYLAAAWLFSQLENNPSKTNVYQVAAWELFANGEPTTWSSSGTNFNDLTSRINSTFKTNVDAALVEALAMANGPNLSFADNWFVVTGEADGKIAQEFLTRIPERHTHVPETSGILLLGFVSALVFGIGLQRRKRELQ